MRRAVGALLGRLGLLRPARSAYRLAVGRVRTAAWLLGGKRTDCGIAVPPPHLSFRSAADYDTSRFLATGRRGIESVGEMLADMGRPLPGFGRLLDLGCGCGRILRHLPQSGGPAAVGADIDGEAVRWCGRNLPGAFVRTGLADPLPFGPESFDLVLAVAVICHLSLPHQRSLLREMGRILGPGGTALVTVKGPSRRYEIPSRLVGDFDAGRPVVVEPEFSGTRYCLAYHPTGALEGLLPPGLKSICRAPLGSRDTGQDVCLLAPPPP